MQSPQLLISLLPLIITTQSSCAHRLYDFHKLEWDLNWSAGLHHGPDHSIPRGDHPEAGLPFRLEVWRSNPQAPLVFFVTVPRLRNSSFIPAGLNTLTPPGGSRTGLLRPFPNWEINKLGNCANLQSPTGVVVGRNDLLYVVDTGRVDVLTPSPRNLCPAKLVIFSMTGQLVESYEFPDSVVSRTNNFLTDIVLDYVDPEDVLSPKFAYITDASVVGNIVVFDFTTNSSRIFTDQRNYRLYRNLFLHGNSYDNLTSISSIALMPDFNFLYYSVTGYRILWQIPTWVLRNSSIGYFLMRNMEYLECNFGALIAGSSGLYYGALEFDAILRWEIAQDRKAQETSEELIRPRTSSVVHKNWETMHWISALRLYQNLNYPERLDLYYLSNKAHLFLTGQMSFNSSEVNFRIGRLDAPDTMY